jgi:biotin transport system substrate-specific component
MNKSAAPTLVTAFVADRALRIAREAALVLGASLFVALCARLTVPLPFTPVPLTLQNFGVLLVGLLLGPWRGFAAMAIYLAEGLAGFPVFNRLGPGGIPQLLGPTGGYLMMYPYVAFAAGQIAQARPLSFARAASAATIAELILFAGGVSWIVFAWRIPLSQAAHWGLYPFFFAEVIKVMAAAALAERFSRWRRI